MTAKTGIYDYYLFASYGRYDMTALIIIIANIKTKVIIAIILIKVLIATIAIITIAVVIAAATTSF